MATETQTDRCRAMTCVHGTMREFATRQGNLDAVWYRDSGAVSNGVSGQPPVGAPVEPTVPDAKGILDITFGTDGINSTTPGGIGKIWALVVQSDGKILAGGYASSDGGNTQTLLLARYNTDGSLDTTFGTGGFNLASPGTRDVIKGIAIEDDSQIVVGGWALVSGNECFMLARYNQDGSLDTTFGTNGFNLTTPGNRDGISSIFIKFDGKIMAGGFTSSDGGNTQTFALARYSKSGLLDTTFGINGFSTITPGTYDIINAIAFPASGQIVAGGQATVGGKQRLVLARYNSDGSLDTTFGTNGYNLTTPGNSGQISDVVIQFNNQIVAGGWVSEANTVFSVSRYNASDGSLDTTFGNNGFSVGTPETSDRIDIIALQSNNKVVAGGSVDISGNFYGAVGRYNSNGFVDTSFATNGFDTSSLGQGVVQALVVQQDGKIVVGGNTASQSLFVARFM